MAKSKPKSKPKLGSYFHPTTTAIHHAIREVDLRHQGEIEELEESFERRSHLRSLAPGIAIPAKTISHKSDAQAARELHDLWDTKQCDAKSYAALLRDYSANHVHEDGSPIIPKNLRKAFDLWKRNNTPDRVGPTYKK
jgi:hypothetical protein